jgi:hypothetical protein
MKRMKMKQRINEGRNERTHLAPSVQSQEEDSFLFGSGERIENSNEEVAHRRRKER